MIDAAMLTLLPEAAPFGPVPAQRVADLITSAMEGGSDYWLGRVDPPFQSHEDYSEGNSYGKYMIERKISDDEGAMAGLLNRETIQRGLEKLVDTRHWADFAAENDDAETGDVFLQLALFDEIVFG